MELLVDIGNTSIKWATWDGERLGVPGSAKHFGALPIDLLAAWDLSEDVNGIVVARVGPEAVLKGVADVADALWKSGLTMVETSAESQGVRIAYAEPARLGVDRYLALIGAHHQQGGAKLIVDAGTAVTFDLLLADGTHIGGLILPGIAMMRDSLLAGTQIPCYEPIDADQSWATDTAEAIAAASIQAPAALAERLYQRLADHTGQTPNLIITGGDAERLLPALRPEAVHQPALVLAGLCRFARSKAGANNK
ncbi:MAG: type III pantothenate kinase [Thiohalocapsa sp.]